MSKEYSKMDKWPQKLKLLSVLSMTKEFLIRSENDGWSDERPSEIAKEVDKIISYLLDTDRSGLSDLTKILYAPTGPIQEISISNGWSEAYMLLAAEYDKFNHLINKD